MNRQKEVPAPNLPMEYTDYLQVFWRLRGITGQVENPVTPDIISQWERHTYRTFLTWEREALLCMDGAFRQAHAKVVAWHQKRKQVKLDPDEKRMSSGRGNSRL